MVRTEISLFLKNAPGELGKLALLFGSEGINIDALTIQDASDYVKGLFKARGKSLKRIASVASYNSMRKDSAEFALIKFATFSRALSIASFTSRPPLLMLEGFPNISEIYGCIVSTTSGNGWVAAA